MRRLTALALGAIVLSACSGEQGVRAQQLLNRAQTAQGKLRTAEFAARMTFVMDGRTFSLVMDGGGYLKGARAGDAVLSLRTDGVPGAGSFDLQLVSRRGRLAMSMNGQRLSLPATSTTTKQLDWSSTVVELARYVKKVRVHEGRVVNGERGATITGVIDTKEMLEALSGLETLTEAAKLDDVGGKLGDIHAAVFVAQRTGLIRSAVITMSVEAEGKKADVELTYRLKSTNRTVAGL